MKSLDSLQNGPLWALTVLRGALADFYIRDGALLTLGLGERALAFRLGYHLTLRVGAEWDVDAEYDREGEVGALKVRDDAPRHMRPDLVVHRRGQRARADNLMFIEVKRRWRPENVDVHDLDKVVSAVARHKYQIGVALGLCRQDAPHRFFPAWTVYGWASLRQKLIVESDAVFDSSALSQLEVIARNGTAQLA